MCVHLNYCLVIHGGLYVTQSTRTIRVHRSTRAAFFSSTHLCTRTKEHLVHACLYTYAKCTHEYFLSKKFCVHSQS